MINRCYNKNSTEYKRYGAKGVQVCDRWKNFTNFLEDLPHIENFNKEQFYNNEIELDKDFKQQKCQEKIYSLRTCIFLLCKDNALLA